MISAARQLPETSKIAHAEAMGHKGNDIMRQDIFHMLSVSRVVMSADCLTQNSFIRGRWRKRYQNEHHFLQDIRRRCSELKAAGTIQDSGHRVMGIGGKMVSCWTARGVKSTKPTARQRTKQAIEILEHALTHYGVAAAFHTGSTARVALDRANSLLDG